MTHPARGDLGPSVLQEVSEDVWAYVQPDGSWYLNNTGFLVTRGGVISIDTTSTERRTRAYLDAIAGVTPLPVRTLVNTHHHGDHTYGNCLLPGATIVAHEQTRTEMMAGPLPANQGIWNDVDWGDLRLAPPFLTYDTGGHGFGLGLPGTDAAGWMDQFFHWLDRLPPQH